MDMTLVNSSNLVAVGYDKSTQTLRIKFKSSTYDYYNVPESIFNGLLLAPSKGKYHHAHIKNSYSFAKIG